MKSKFFGILLSFAAFTLMGAAQMSEGGKIVESTIEQVRTLVKAEKGKISEKELNQKVEALVFPVFDFREMARRSLGKNWNSGNPEQREKFVDLFSTLLSRTYMKRVTDGIETAEIKFLGDVEKGKVAVVRTSVSRDNDTFGVDYRMRQIDHKWKAYDVIIENVGLVTNYRNEFAGIIRKDGFVGLLSKLDERVKKLES